jgi:hypothetical protein
MKVMLSLSKLDIGWISYEMIKLESKHSNIIKDVHWKNINYQPNISSERWMFYSALSMAEMVAKIKTTMIV